jgi:hypothetical protein
LDLENLTVSDCCNQARRIDGTGKVIVWISLVIGWIATIWILSHYASSVAEIKMTTDAGYVQHTEVTPMGNAKTRWIPPSLQIHLQEQKGVEPTSKTSTP